MVSEMISTVSCYDFAKFGGCTTRDQETPFIFYFKLRGDKNARPFCDMQSPGNHPVAFFMQVPSPSPSQNLDALFSRHLRDICTIPRVQKEAAILISRYDAANQIYSADMIQEAIDDEHKIPLAMAFPHLSRKLVPAKSFGPDFFLFDVSDQLGGDSSLLLPQASVCSVDTEGDPVPFIVSFSVSFSVEFSNEDVKPSLSSEPLKKTDPQTFR